MFDECRFDAGWRRRRSKKKVGKLKRKAAWEKSDGRCTYCGNVIEYFSGGFAVDHVIPESQGGSSDISNLVACCSSCNTIKGSKDLESFRFSFFCAQSDIPFFSQKQIEGLKQTSLVNDLPEFYFELRALLRKETLGGA